MLRRSTVVALSIGLALASCGGDHSQDAPATRAGAGPGGADGDTPDDTGAAPGGEGTSKARRDICATLDYGHTRSNDDYFLQFDDDAAALKYAKGFLAANDISDAFEMTDDARTLRLVGRVFDGFRKVFPSETAGMAKAPRVMTVHAEGINAFAGYDEREEVRKAPWIFWVHQPTIDSNKPDAQLEALYAHELAHLILRNMLPETRKKIRTHYRVPGGKEKGVIGEIAPDDDAVRSRAEELRAIGDLVGREAAFGAIPVSAYEDSRYQSLLQTLAKKKPAGADAQACGVVDDSVKQARTLYRQNVSVHDLTLELAPADAARVARLSDGMKEALRTCYAGVKTSILELKIEDMGVQVLVDGKPAPAERLVDRSTPEGKLVYETLMKNPVEQEVDAKADLSIGDRILEVVERLHARAAELGADASLPLDELRVFDLEEDADDAAVRILRAVGDDDHGAADLFATQLPDPGACTREIANGEVPRYGRFIDPHNATCWRAFHSLDLADALARCPTTPPAASADGAAPEKAARLTSALRLVQRTKPRLRRR